MYVYIYIHIYIYHIVYAPTYLENLQIYQGAPHMLGIYQEFLFLQHPCRFNFPSPPHFSWHIHCWGKRLALFYLCQRIAKGAGGKGPCQKTSKIVKKCQKVFRHFSTIFAQGKKRQKSSNSVTKFFDTFRQFSRGTFFPAPFAIRWLCRQKNERSCDRDGLTIFAVSGVLVMSHDSYSLETESLF